MKTNENLYRVHQNGIDPGVIKGTRLKSDRLMFLQPKKYQFAYCFYDSRLKPLLSENTKTFNKMVFINNTFFCFFKDLMDREKLPYTIYTEL